MIVIIDCGLGNVASIANIVRKVGGNACISSDPSIIETASKLILPGVGSFDFGITQLRNSAFYDLLITKVIDDHVPILGICLGMQLLFQESAEGVQPGLGWLKGHIKKFDFSTLHKQSTLKIPHMGWNNVKVIRRDGLFSQVAEDDRFYFVHSYYVICDDPTDVIGTSFYGYDFICAVQHGNIYGVQFHPEKSHRYGMTLMKCFLDL